MEPRRTDRTPLERLSRAPSTQQSGVALVSVMLAIFILTVVVAALVLATMGETGLSFDQSRSSQAVHLAEAGAYRALAELRRRLSADFDANVRSANPLIVQGHCNSNQGWRIIASYGGPGWVDEDAITPGVRRAYLDVGTATSPVQVRDASGNVLGSVSARIYVRPTDNSTPPPASNICITSGVESYQMWFDYFIIATGVTRNAQRTVCLKNPGNMASCGQWLASSTPGTTTWDTAPATHGFPVLIEAASYSRWALLVNSASTWMVTGTTFLGPVHSNGSLAIWGNPLFQSTVSQVGATVSFGNCGSVTNLPQASNAPCDQPTYQLTPLQVGAAAIGPPSNDSPFWAVLDNPAGSGTPANSPIRGRSTALANNGTAIPGGIYFMDECGNPVCGGIFVQGTANNIVLACDPSPCGTSSKQAVIITAAGQSVKYILDSATNTKECTGPPSFATCVDKGKGFNGMLYVNGGILRTAGNPLTGLYGVVQKNTRLSIAADGAIQITNHLVYESPPTGPLDPIPNVLGLYSWCSATPPTAPNCPSRNVTLDANLAPNDLYIDASVLAPWGQFWVQGWDTSSNKGTLHFLGGVVQDTFGPWGGFTVDAFGNITGYTGYGREMTFDQRFLTNNAPPFFPLTNQYTAPRYPRLNPDPLYDRPLWEELTAP